MNEQTLDEMPGSSEQAPRVDRPLKALCCATTVSLPATQGQRWKDADSRIRMALGLNMSELLQELFPFSEGEARLW